MRLVLAALAALLVATAAVTTAAEAPKKKPSMARNTQASSFSSQAFALDKYFLVLRRDGTYYVSPKPTQQPPFLNPGDALLASARYNASNDALGWDYLHVAPDPTLVQAGIHKDMAYYYSGLIEGALTWQGMSNVFPYATIMPPVGSCEHDWIVDHMKYIFANSNRSTYHSDIEEAYWTQVRRILKQMQGLAMGFNIMSPTVRITEVEVFVSNLLAREFYNIKNYCENQRRTTGRTMSAEENVWKQHVSEQVTRALVMVKPTTTDLIVGHTTWGPFEYMAHRIYKVYEFDTTLSFSSYPGLITSGDEFYQTSNRMIVVSAATMQFDANLFDKVQKNSVSAFVRLLVALYLGSSSGQFNDIIAYNNSGTINSQLLVIDNKLYTPNMNMPPNTVWLIEQIPGTVVGSDVSGSFQTNGGYFALYGIPYDQSIRRISGFEEMEARYGSFYSHANTPMAALFKSAARGMHSMEAMMVFLRSNDYRGDSRALIPNCTGATNNQCTPKYSPMLQIAGRGDLGYVYDNTYPGWWDAKAVTAYLPHYGNMWYEFAGGCKGAIDAKIAAWTERDTMMPIVQSGPSIGSATGSEELAPFQWDRSRMCLFGEYTPKWLTPDQRTTAFVRPWVLFHTVENQRPYVAPKAPRTSSPLATDIPSNYLLYLGRGLQNDIVVTDQLQSEADIPQLSKKQRVLGWARFNRSNYETGWDYLHIHIDDSLVGPDATWAEINEGYKYAGYIEGYLTYEMMNTLNPYSVIMPPVDSCEWTWISEHYDYIKMMTQYTDKDSESIQKQVYRLLNQLAGMAFGFNVASKQAVPPGPIITEKEVFVDNLKMFELDEIAEHCQLLRSSRGEETEPKAVRQWRLRLSERKAAARRPMPSDLTDEEGKPIFSSSSSVHKERSKRRLRNMLAHQHSHCSGAVVPTRDELFLGHTTWGAYPQMAYRQYKIYRLDTTVSMSSYPGMIMSGDEYYTNSHGVGVMATSIALYNDALLAKVKPNSISRFLRVMAANYLSTNGEMWSDILMTNQSGTAPAQYVIVDFNQFQPGKALGATPKVLYVAEQIPGSTVAGDQTSVLASQGYWASYNVPQYPQVWIDSGYGDEYSYWGSFYSRTHSPRAQMFARNATAVTDAASFGHLIRYNDYQYDPLSAVPNCTGSLHGECYPARSSLVAIAARGDLMPLLGLRYPGWWDSSAVTSYQWAYGDMWYHFAGGCHGATDAKITSSVLVKGMNALVVSGPTADQQPPFAWSSGMCRAGRYVPSFLPDGWASGDRVYDFPWMLMQPMGAAPGPYNHGGAPGAKAASSGGKVAVAVVVTILVIGLVVVLPMVLYHFRRRIFGKKYREVGESGELSSVQ